MENETKAKLEELERKIDLIYISVEKTRNYIFWTMIVTVVVFVLPIIGLIFAIPSFLKGLDTLNQIGI